MPGIKSRARRRPDDGDDGGDQELPARSRRVRSRITNDIVGTRPERESAVTLEDASTPESRSFFDYTTQENSNSYDEVGGSDTPAETRFKPGSIVRVKLTNFVTYTSAEFHLGPSLNLIIGPNGNGKSTLVCAICLGLGWGPQHLGRATELSAFVKYGSHEADIEIELAGGPSENGRNPIIRRNIQGKENTSEFFINGEKSSKKKVLELAKSFSIQIDNLCQFLPQDRVPEFAALTPIELLEATQHAVAPPEMVEWHNQLKTQHRTLKEEQQAWETDSAKLEDLQKRQNMAELDIERIRERQMLLTRSNTFKKSRPLVQFRLKRSSAMDAKERKRLAQQQFQEVEKSVETILRSITAKEAYHDQIDGVVHAMMRAAKEDEARVMALFSRQQKLQDDIRDDNTKRKAEQEAENVRKAKVAELEKRIHSLEGLMREPPPEFDEKDFTDRIRDKYKQMRTEETRLNQLDEKLRDLRTEKTETQRQAQQAQKELEDMRSRKGQQLKKLKLRSNDAAIAWEWLQSNKSEFEGAVYGPPIIECSVRDPRYTSAMEAVLRKGDLCAFTCTNDRDFETLQHHLLSPRRLNLSDIHIRTIKRPFDSWNAPMPTEELARYGLDSWLISQLDGPEAVLSMLCDNANLHKTGVTLKKLSDAQYQMLEQSVLQDWIDSQSKYRVNRRREYNASSTMVTALNQPTIWNEQGVDAGDIQQAKDKIYELSCASKEIDEKVHSLDTERKVLKAALDLLRSEKAQLQNERKTKLQELNEFLALPQKRETYRIKLQSYQQESANSKQTMAMLIENSESIAMDRAELAVEYAKKVGTLLENRTALWEAAMWRVEALSEKEALNEENKQTKDMLEELRKSVHNLEVEYERCREEAKRLEKECRSIKFTEEEQEFVPPLETIAAEELEAQIQLDEARLDLLQTDNPNTVREFEERGRLIDGLKTKLDKLRMNINATQDIINEVRSKWEPGLDSLVQQISDAFADNFNRMGCAGQVSIHKDDDFEKWSLQIQVKFRENAQLSILDSQKQSGGERAVSTIFYLMALQSLARSPFRVVDEINQGMDPRNERMVYERMVEIVCHEHSSQYFLITPKLLPGLRYDKRMKIHVIASGEHMPKDSPSLNFKDLAHLALRVRGKS